MSRKVSLFVRLWVEIHRSCRNSNPGSCQPLRETVSWNMTGDYMVAVQEGQPLREAVSWNSLCQRNLTEKVGSASSWGCELKYYSLIITGKCFTVSLFVRLWVEMYDRGWNDALEKSASSWGCELKFIHAVYDVPGKAVSLFVRLWVEIVRILSTSELMAVSLFVRLWVEMNGIGQS